ncbi:MAG: hypothetical protein ACRDBR_02225 [Metamycoplasmataceae bacterium]
MKKANIEPEYSKYSAIWFVNDSGQKEWKVIEDKKTWYRKFSTQAEAIDYFKALKKPATLRIQSSNSKAFGKTIMTKMAYDEFTTIENFDKAYANKNKEDEKKAPEKKEAKKTPKKKEAKKTPKKKEAKKTPKKEEVKKVPEKEEVKKASAKKEIKKPKKSSPKKRGKKASKKEEPKEEKITPIQEEVVKPIETKPEEKKYYNNDFSYTQILDDLLVSQNSPKYEVPKNENEDNMFESQVIDLSSNDNLTSTATNTVLFDLDNIDAAKIQDNNNQENDIQDNNLNSKEENVVENVVNHVVENTVNNINDQELTNEDFFHLLDEHDIKSDPIEKPILFEKTNEVENIPNEILEKEKTIETDLESLAANEFVSFSEEIEEEPTMVKNESINITEKTEDTNINTNENILPTKNHSTDKIKEVLEKDNVLLMNNQNDLITEEKNKKVKSKITIYVFIIIFSSLILIASIAIFILFLLSTL